MALEHELQVFNVHLLELLETEGQFVVVCGVEISGGFETYAKALEAGYEKYGLTPFLVKQVFKHEPVEYFSRDLALCRS